ncbi:MAG: AAA family ATPase [Spirochaetales bacterium]|nr:AAA family ATPase [Spirochaetales bacterium]
MYFSKDDLISLYKKLSSLYPGNDIEAQGGTQFVSELRYFFATDEFKKNKSRACDTKIKEDKELFIKYVGSLVYLSNIDSNTLLSTKNFYKSLGESKDFNVGSNFFSVNVVKSSMLSDSSLRFPERHAQLLTVTKGVLDISENGYSNISSSQDYLGNSVNKFAILFLWLNRYVKFDSVGTLYSNFLNYLKTKYTANLITSLKWNTEIVKTEINNIIQEFSFTDEPYYLSKDDFIFETVTGSNDKEITKPHNRIIFGAPGTGKSFILSKETEAFIDDNSKDKEQAFKNEIKSAGSEYSKNFALGIKYYNELKGEKPKSLAPKFNISRNAAYTIYQGMRIAEKIKELPDFSEEEISDEKITEQLNKILAIKYMNQAGAGLIGFKYADYLTGRNAAQIAKDFNLNEKGSIPSWVTIGVDASDYTYNEDENIQYKRFERVTFHPNYSYAQFVGTYKPVQDEQDEQNIKYEYVPGPFMRIYVDAINEFKRAKSLKIKPKNYLLLIEEINRANVAAVFGDVFQLLDRDKDGNSEYPIAASEDIKKYLKRNGIDDLELKIPSNMYIWATMNSADQGVLPMDAAFKRRWNFEYLGIDDNENWNYIIPLPNNESINWNVLRKAINNKLKKIDGVNEDKLLGPYFISKSNLDNIQGKISNEQKEDFIKTFKSKVLMYLYEDVCKMRPTALFEVQLDDGQTKPQYSDICKAFDENGIAIFGFKKDEIESKYNSSSSGVVGDKA